METDFFLSQNNLFSMKIPIIAFHNHYSTHLKMGDWQATQGKRLKTYNPLIFHHLHLAFTSSTSLMT
jgi:hypothetical protein